MKDKTELENLVVLKTPTKANISSSQAKGRGARGYMKDYKLKITGCNDPLKWYSDTEINSSSYSLKVSKE